MGVRTCLIKDSFRYAKKVSSKEFWYQILKYIFLINNYAFRYILYFYCFEIMRKGTIFLLLLLMTSFIKSSIIPSNFIIQSPPNYRGQIILRYFELKRHNILRSRHNSQLLKLNSVLSKRAQVSAERMLK
jgi:hypothetical protein